MADDDKPSSPIVRKNLLSLGEPNVEANTPVFVEFATSTSSETLTALFGPDIWRAPQLPVRRPPDDHAVYNLVGRVASEWSHVEHTLDTVIWALAGIDPEAGGCITSQMMGHYARFKVIVSLLTLHERNSQMKTADLTAKANKLMGKANLPADQRNRNVHDPWYVFDGYGTPGQFKTMPKGDFKFGVHPTDLPQLEKALKDTKDFAVEVESFRTDVIRMLNLATLPGIKGG